MSERVQVWVPAVELESAKTEAKLEGVSVNAWLESAADEHVALQRALRAQEASEGPVVVPFEREEALRRGLEREWDRLQRADGGDAMCPGD
jgi:hypothetical protein